MVHVLSRSGGRCRDEKVVIGKGDEVERMAALEDVGPMRGVCYGDYMV